MDNYLFVSVGHPDAKPTTACKNIPVKVKEGASPLDLAKAIRKHFAAHPFLLGFHREIKFKPQDFFWAIFPEFDGKKPIAASDNFYWRRK